MPNTRTGLLRLIPACAGKTRESRAAASLSTAHPRVCGENLARIYRQRLRPGSSPRVRGKLGSQCADTPIAGLIPACAGKTTGRYQPSRRGRAHPRVCGENELPPSKLRSTMGSSPRVRGKLSVAAFLIAIAGLIPACAGKTAAMFLTPSQSWAHPRVCGENRRASRRERPGMGSSPRVRGKPAPPPHGENRPGLIPACAGKTYLAPPLFSRKRAHPRVCGENRRFRRGRFRCGGSSPRVRGKPSPWKAKAA